MNRREITAFKLKIASQACIACKRRKVKCVGNPCAYCIKKNYVCQFDIGKKRGPPKRVKILKVVQECGTVSVVLLNRIQASMDAAYRQSNFVEFYFQYIGRPIPRSCKAPLLSSQSELNSDLITQLYIVSAEVMKFFGNNDLELQCIAKAQKFASNIFSSDSLESAVSLMMMANYLGQSHHKFSTYITLALQITELPLLQSSLDAIKTKYACQAQLVLRDNTLSIGQKYDHVVSKIFSRADQEQIAYDLMDQCDVIAVITIKVKRLLIFHANYDDSNNQAFIKTLTNPTKLLTAEHRLTLIMELDSLDNAVSKIRSNHSGFILGLFTCPYLRFIVEWRSGNTAAAIEAAENSLKVYKENKGVLGLWFSGGFVASLNLPYFFQINGLADKTIEILACFEESATNNNLKLELREAWKELCKNTIDLPPSTTPEILCFSESILQFENYVSQPIIQQPLQQPLQPLQPLQQPLQQQNIIPQIMYQTTPQILFPQQNNFPIMEHSFGTDIYNYDNDDNKNNINNFNITESIVYFDADTLSDLLFSPMY